jgi:hypothetical protein
VLQGDPSSASHPIHPPFKEELARRANLIFQNFLFDNASSPVQVRLRKLLLLLS